MVVALASLLAQQAAPHPSTLRAYEAPVVRPFEPAPDFGLEPAQGDGEAAADRRPLEAPVAVDAYARSYEFSPGDAEAAYDQGVASAEVRADQAAGPMAGRWQVADERGELTFGLLLNETGGLVEGGWRQGGRSGAAAYEGGVVTLDGLGSLAVAADGRSGVLTRGERSTPVILSRP
ncbi:hypothetical protein [Brevundimonas lenta]|uniref:Uncharacterized protein n=1 Tax=Brevundimonas lenta TaxID=424796 RepID=A0A7W6J9Z9_9CAUL|nr:hypothetical protein [Brevundimonas lenta]MBB4081295.1 hypothetical protein [Brevundimonas lenta]